MHDDIDAKIENRISTEIGIALDGEIEHKLAMAVFPEIEKLRREAENYADLASDIKHMHASIEELQRKLLPE